MEHFRGKSGYAPVTVFAFSLWKCEFLPGYIALWSASGYHTKQKIETGSLENIAARADEAAGWTDLQL